MNLDHQIKAQDIQSYIKKGSRIFFMRICGTGMGACAAILKEAGFHIEGADTSYAPPMSDFLDSLHIPCHDLSKVDDEFLKGFDLIVVGNSVGRQSDLARTIEGLGVPFTSFPTLLGELILKEREVYAVIGTHGKTTTSYFLTQILENLGEKPGYFIGGVIEGRNCASIGTSKAFVIEGDEYDSSYFQKYSKFHQYYISHAICTSLEFDHADIFASFDDMKKEFFELFEKVEGQIVFEPSYMATSEVLSASGVSKDRTHAYSPILLEKESHRTKFSLKLNGDDYTFVTNIVGEHNIANIAGCIQVLFTNGYHIEDLQKAIIGLKMVKRRQELRGKFNHALIIDDFAHHPKAVSETVKTIQTAYPDKKITVVFEPVSATARSNVFQDAFATSFESAHTVIIADTQIQTTAKSYEQLDTAKLSCDIKTHGIDSSVVRTLDELIEEIKDTADSKRLFLILSNRTCLGLWGSDFAKNIQ